MSVLFQTVINTGKLYSYRNLTKTISSCSCVLVRKISDVPRKFITFDEVVAARRAEARRSLVVQVNSEGSFSELHSYCSKYADIKGIHHYKNISEEHFMLIEFNTEENLKDVLQNCCSHQKDIDVMSLQSPFLWFRAAPGNKDKQMASCSASLVTKDGSSFPSEDTLFEELMGAATVSDQIQLLYDRTKLNDLSVRLRYLVAREVEIVMGSLYANVEVRPFGSSVNGFGRMGCDLDLVLSNVLTDEMTDPSKRLVFQEKRGGGGSGPLELCAGALELRVAGARRVQRILHARVPIVKFAHHHADIDCDLCHANMSGVYMSELLHLVGGLDGRGGGGAALVFAVRRWAAAAALTAAAPGRWITNFPLTLLVLFFLQQGPQPLLPTVRYLVQKAEKEDIRKAEDNLNCTFLRDANKLPLSAYSQNDASLETLLLQFFEFYAQFDFQGKAVSLNEGAAIRKPNALPLYIVNPLEQSMNVSRNVSYEECERLKLEVRNAAWQLEAALETGKTDDWGLLGLIEKKTTRGLKKLLRVGNSHRLVSVKDLFTNDEEQPSSIKDKLEKLGKKSDRDSKTVREVAVTTGDKKERIKFKNSQVASEVYRIRRDKMI
ncbi:LOW QUALITY PROTEIN: mitochondrial poly(A) polymerase [Choristoneura fumiferana]|uniref:LOW QUALITY PROTEIN: mitochondrial poly(A) polymerase n=1 Tax=Choristoneura fumiferana TaxID=7141 RepID=UPI003D154A67